jgi:hypothetical protein
MLRKQSEDVARTWKMDGGGGTGDPPERESPECDVSSRVSIITQPSHSPGLHAA